MAAVGNTHPGRPISELDKLFAHLSRLNGVGASELSIQELKTKIANRIAVLIEAEMEQLNPSDKKPLTGQAAQDLFVATHPEYFACEENGKALRDEIAAQGYKEYTIENIELAYLTVRQALKQRPAQK